MATAKQIAANRANALKSTGPRTPEGKAVVSQNHLSHGFEASNTFVLIDEKLEDFQALLADFMQLFQPANLLEQILVEKMVQNQWLGLRATRHQTFTLMRMEPMQGMPKDLGLLIRYQAACDRAFHKAHAELLKAQKERQNSEIGFEPENLEAHPQADLEMPPAALPEPPAGPEIPTVTLPVCLPSAATRENPADLLDKAA